jgi:hypothetical protein
VKEVTFFLANIRLWSKFFEPSFNFAYVVYGDPEVTDARLQRASSRLEERDIIKAIGERDVPRVGAAQLAHGKVGGIKARQRVRMFADNRQIANL